MTEATSTLTRADPFACFPWNQRRCDNLAIPAEIAELPMYPVSARACLIAKREMRVSFSQLPHSKTRDARLLFSTAEPAFRSPPVCWQSPQHSELHLRSHRLQKPQLSR